MGRNEMENNNQAVAKSTKQALVRFYIVKVIDTTQKKRENEKILKSKTLERKLVNLGRKSVISMLDNWCESVNLLEFPFCSTQFSFH